MVTLAWVAACGTTELVRPEDGVSMVGNMKYLIDCDSNPDCDTINGDHLFHIDPQNGDGYTADAIGTYQPSLGDTTKDGQPITPATETDLGQIAAEAARLANMDNPICRQLGSTISNGISNVRFFGKTYREYNPLTGRMERVVGYYQPGSGMLYISRGVDSLNPYWTLTEKLQIIRHEYAHRMGYGDTWYGGHTAEEISQTCK